MKPERIIELKKNYWMSERDVGPLLHLTGRFNYDEYLKWTMEFHIAEYIGTHEVVSHTIHGHDLHQMYSVLMRSRS